ncbi:MAG TPA: cation-transporting P-type ATPase [Methylococcaceae bacterium]|nr:cation-transporting P-type ATPase [Methylococcaceae bacterium]
MKNDATNHASAVLRRTWHSLPAGETLEILGSHQRHGLTEQEAEERLKRFGPNELPKASRRSAWMRFLLQFHNVLIYVLLASASVTALLGDWVDTAVILGVVVINALIGFIQEGKAEAALEAIRAMLSLSALVLRDGRRRTIPAERLVPGDLVLLQSGDKVPADLRLIEVKNLRVQEAVLTGESEPVEKTTETAPLDAVPGDRFCMAYSGTLVTYGQGLGVVIGTAAETEIGRIGALLTRVEAVATPLLRKMEKFGHWLTAAILLLAAATFGFGLLGRGYPLQDMFMAAVGLAVAAIPEGLPAIVTVTLAIGVRRMAGRNAIIRHLPAVETLGSVTVICSDKTGTLTQNEMTAQTVATAGQMFAVGGVGYAPHGGFSAAGRDVSVADHAELTEAARAALLCNDASLRESEDGWRLEGDPTEGALVTLGMKAGFDPAFEHEAFPRIDAIPFESEHRFMATLHRDHAGHAFIYLKGAPEVVLERCRRQRRKGEDHPLDMALWEGYIQQLAASGQRLLAVAIKPLDEALDRLRFADADGGFTLLGLVGLIDPPREEAVGAVARCQHAGIRIKMITGDHGVTAGAIGARLNIGGDVLTGSEIETLNDEELARRVRDVNVFARASPEHKLRLVRALQSNGQVVAMTGDGVNDAPALKRADVGVAMGLKGTEAAKEAADMVLADDNFASIAHAVEEGRTVYDNLKKAIVYILPTSFGEAGAIVVAILLGVTLPITPLQILWVNLVTAVALSLPLAFERPEDGVMNRPPRPPAEPLLTVFAVWRVAFVAVLLVIGLLWMFFWEIERGASHEVARTAAVNTLVMGEIVYLFNSRYLYASSLSWRGLFGNRYALMAVPFLLAIQGLFSYAPFMQQAFGTAAIDLSAWGRIAAFGIALFALVELEKQVLRNHRQSKQSPSTQLRNAIRFAARLSLAGASLAVLWNMWQLAPALYPRLAAPSLETAHALPVFCAFMAVLLAIKTLVECRLGHGEGGIALDVAAALALALVARETVAVESLAQPHPWAFALLALAVAYWAVSAALWMMGRREGNN